MEDNLPAFERAGVAYLALGGVGLEGVWEDMRVIGRFLRREERAGALIADMQQRMARIAARRRQAVERPRVHWEWSAHPVVAARRSWITEMLTLAGAENVYSDLDVESVRVAPEEAIARQPDADPLAAGELISSGTLTNSAPIAAGETWRAEVEGIALSPLTLLT